MTFSKHIHHERRKDGHSVQQVYGESQWPRV